MDIVNGKQGRISVYPQISEEETLMNGWIEAGGGGGDTFSWGSGPTETMSVVKVCKRVKDEVNQFGLEGRRLSRS